MNSRQFAILVSITFFVGMVWLISDIIFNTKPSIPVSDKLESSLEPLDPNLDPKVWEIIDKEVIDKNKMVIPASRTTGNSPTTTTASASGRTNI